MAHIILHVLVAGLLARIGSAFVGQPAVCAWEPAAIVEAGSLVSAKFYNPWGSRCEAIAQFSDPAYLPITWTFDPIICKGQQLGQFIMPEGAPNGDAVISWQCAGQDSPTCNHILIRNGLGSMDSEELLRLGRVGCIISSLQTTTTMETRTSASATVTRVMSSVITLSTTSFASISTRAIPAMDSEAFTSTRPGTPPPETPPPETPPSTTTNSVPNAAPITAATTTTTPFPDGLDPGSSADAKSATLDSTPTPTIMSTELLTATPAESLSLTTAPTNTETTMTTNTTPPATTVSTDTDSTPRTTGTNPGKDPLLENKLTTVAVMTMTVTEAGSCTSMFTA